MGTTTLDAPPELSIKEDSGLKGINVVDEAQGIVEAFVSVTGVKDRVNDIIEPGAYTKTLATRTPKGLVGHDWKQLVSKVVEIKELLPGDGGLPDTLSNGDPWPSNAGALKVKAQYNLNTERGRDAFEDAKFFGTDQEWSIGYSVPKTKEAAQMVSGVRRIKQLDLFEYSQVLWGAMPHARTTSVKEADIEIEVKDGKASMKETMTMDDGSYPIKDTASLSDAIQAYGRSKNKVACKAHIKRAASALGATDMLPDKWNDKGEDDADTEHKDVEDQENVIGDTGDKTMHLSTLQDAVIEAEGNMNLALAFDAFKALGAFLHAEKAISDDLFTKVTGEVLEAKVYETMSDIAADMGEKVFGDSAVEFKVLAGQYDFAIESEDEKLIKRADVKVANFIAKQLHSADDDTQEEIKSVAQMMIDLLPEDTSDDDDSDDGSKDDDTEDIEKKAAPVTMTPEQLAAMFGRTS